jgi:hypothetical protein
MEGLEATDDGDFDRQIEHAPARLPPVRRLASVPRRAVRRARRHWDPARVVVQTIGGVYVLLAMIVLFSIWVPGTFPSGRRTAI